MKLALLMMAILLLVASCSPNGADTRSLVDQCWDTARIASNNLEIKSVDFIYLQDRTIIVPSNTCHVRLQATEFSPSAAEEFRQIGLHQTEVPLGFHGNLIFSLLKRPAAHVVEIRVVSIKPAEKLDSRTSATLMDKILHEAS
jgi:hypothetical protein